ncbi:hypothetical protein Pelo_3353 [Pelomyxa schiedti]|nr:hypothetical protein Pelo_3353 [Pelomyxa schiedti]
MATICPKNIVRQHQLRRGLQTSHTNLKQSGIFFDYENFTSIIGLKFFDSIEYLEAFTMCIHSKLSLPAVKHLQLQPLSHCSTSTKEGVADIYQAVDEDQALRGKKPKLGEMAVDPAGCGVVPLVKATAPSMLPTHIVHHYLQWQGSKWKSFTHTPSPATCLAKWLVVVTLSTTETPCITRMLKARFQTCFRMEETSLEESVSDISETRD